LSDLYHYIINILLFITIYNIIIIILFIIIFMLFSNCCNITGLPGLCCLDNTLVHCFYCVGW